jgi:hypothetical protein
LYSPSQVSEGIFGQFKAFSTMLCIVSRLDLAGVEYPHVPFASGTDFSSLMNCSIRE